MLKNYILQQELNMFTCTKPYPNSTSFLLIKLNFIWGASVHWAIPHPLKSFGWNEVKLEWNFNVRLCTYAPSTIWLNRINSLHILAHNVRAALGLKQEKCAFLYTRHLFFRYLLLMFEIKFSYINIPNLQYTVYIYSDNYVSELFFTATDKIALRLKF